MTNELFVSTGINNQNIILVLYERELEGNQYIVHDAREYQLFNGSSEYNVECPLPGYLKLDNGLSTKLFVIKDNAQLELIKDLSCAKPKKIAFLPKRNLYVTCNNHNHYISFKTLNEQDDATTYNPKELWEPAPCVYPNQNLKFEAHPRSCDSYFVQLYVSPNEEYLVAWRQTRNFNFFEVYKIELEFIFFIFFQNTIKSAIDTNFMLQLDLSIIYRLLNTINREAPHSSAQAASEFL